MIIFQGLNSAKQFDKAQTKLIQERLIALGYPLTPDGDFGIRTTAAIQAFQKTKNLQSDGIVGRSTWEVLFRDITVASKPAIKKEMDKSSAEKIEFLHPKIRKEVEDLVNKANAVIAPNLQVRIVQGLRTIAEQDALYQQGRTKPGPKVTNAPGGSSAHNYGLAIDFAFLVDGKTISWDTTKDFDNDGTADWKEVVKLFKDAGYVWGGDWKSIKDYPHFEKFFTAGWRTLLNLYNSGKTTKEIIDGKEYKYVIV